MLIWLLYNIRYGRRRGVAGEKRRKKMTAIETIEYIKNNISDTSIYLPVIKSLAFPITEEQAEAAFKECKIIQASFYEKESVKYGF